MELWWKPLSSSELDNVNIAETLNVAGITTFNVDTGFIGGGAGITSAYWDQSAASFKFLDNGKFNLLKWDRQEQMYYPLEINLYEKGKIDDWLRTRSSTICNSNRCS